jgi:hypothetical protein
MRPFHNFGRRPDGPAPPNILPSDGIACEKSASTPASSRLTCTANTHLLSDNK